MYHERSRELQDRFDTRRLADRLAETLSRTEFTAEDRAFIESRAMFFLATADAEGNLAELVEKPDAATVARLGDSAVVSMNCWLCSPAIFDAARAIEPSARGEYEITDAVRRAIADGDPYRVVRASVGVLDMSNRGDIASVMEALGGREALL